MLNTAKKVILKNRDGEWLIPYTNSGGGSGFALFDTKLSDHLLEGDEALGWALQGTYVSKAIYPDFYAKCLEQKEAAIATETTLSGSTITLYNHSNGHKFYDIVDKAVVDTFYSVMGSAWFYGIDSENERIFLPRNDYFEQASTTGVGDSVQAGLPQHTHTRGTMNITGSFEYYSVLGEASGAFSRTQTTTGNPGGGSNGRTGDVTLNASKSWTGSTSDANYTNSLATTTTVQPNAVKKLLYICVGNTTVNESLVDVGQLSSDLQYKADKTEVDGQWVNKSITLSTATALNTYTIDLSGYLPNDGYVYEVLFWGEINNTGNSVPSAAIGTDIINLMSVCKVKGAGTGTYVGLWNIILPVGLERKVTYTLGSTKATSAKLLCSAYRRIGTNL